MYILGIGGSQHDFSYCLLKDKKIITYIEEERVSREKHSGGLRSALLGGIQYCLDANGLSIDDIGIIVSNNQWGMAAFADREYYANIMRVNHHMAHAAASYYGSGFKDSAVFVADGAGDHYSDGQSNTISLGFAIDNKITIFNSIWGQENLYTDYLGTRNEKYAYLPYDFRHKSGMDRLTLTDNSIGDFYSLITYMIGFNLLEEGKTMGLAPYGRPIYYDRIKEFITVGEKGKDIAVKIDINGIYNQLIYIIKNNKEAYYSDILKTKADIACTGQVILEELVFCILNHLYEKTGCKSLSYGGGVALNSVLNGKIKQKTKFEDVFIFPAAGDSGLAYGAAIYAHYQYNNKDEMNSRFIYPFLGRAYTNVEIEQTLSRYSGVLRWSKMPADQLYEKTAKMLAENKIIGWFTEGSEIGPRALGHRSILANPMPNEMKDILNNLVKFREPFRPFAPAVLREKVSEYFDTDFEDNPFMLYVASVKEKYAEKLGAVTHVDQTARLQTVSRDENKVFYELISAFEKITGIPILLNTSFNIKGQPIVETPLQAVESFLNSGIHYLVIEDYFIDKINKN
ncbi:MAG: carbamoyl transferase [Defluviitaleaceae bacterium]|nr:carbamoyl transferase [Defluviitaleaceae bacterium]